MNNLKNIFTHAIVIFLCAISNNIAKAQVAIPNTTTLSQPFTIGATATASLPTGWKMTAPGTASPTWANVNNVTATLQQASSGSPVTGSRYNWGNSVTTTDRAIGFMTSGSYASPSSIMVQYQNTNASNLTSLTVAYDLERYRINTAAASVQFFYSTDGSTWTAVPAGDIAATSLPTGTSAYNFNPSGAPSNVNCGVINKTGISITGINIVNNGFLYLRWNLNTTGASSQGIGIDNVSVTAAFASVTAPVASGGSPTGTYNSAFSYNLVATQSPTSYALASGTLPPGLSLNTSTGAITGTPTAAGSYSITFTASNAAGTSSPATVNFTIAKANQTITFNTPASVPYGTAPGMLTATSSSGLAVSFTSATPSVAALSGTNNTIITYGVVGSSNITANQVGDANWNAATAVVRAQVVTARALTVSGLTGVSKTYDGTTPTTASGTATLNGVLAGDVGNVTLSGTPAFNFNTATVGTGKPITVTGYILAGSAAANYTVTQPTGLTANVTVKTITVSGAVASNKTYDGTNAATITGATLSGVETADIGNVLCTTGTFASVNVGTGIAVTAILTGSAAGNYTLTQPGLTANITQASQTITFGALADRFSGGANFALTATASSGLTVTYTSSNPAVATVAGSTVTIVGLGSTIITASQAGNSNYAAAANVQQTQLIISAPVNMGDYLFTGLTLAPSNVITNTTFSNITLATINQNNASNSITNAFSGAPSTGDWGTAINTGRYLQFTVSANSGFVLNLYSLDMDRWASGAGATNYSIRSSLDSYASNIATGTVPGSQTSISTVVLPSGFTGITTVTFRIYGYGGSSTGDFRLDNISVDGTVTSTCTSPTALAFQTQPVSSAQDVVIPVSVKAICSGGNTATGLNTGSVTISTNNTGCGLEVSGSPVSSVTANFVNGVATFNNVSFSRSTQNNVSFTTTNNQILTNVTSNNFNITTPVGGSPTNTTIVNETFESTTQWAYVVGSPSYSGSGGGTDVTGIKTISSNKSLCKSYSINNAADEKKSTTTVTFDNQNISAYNYATFSFQLASLGSGSGAGVDGGDNYIVQISLDGGSSWYTTLTYYGNNDYLIPFSTTPVTSLNYNSNASFTSGTKSAFSVQLPNNASQFRFRVTGTNNRSNENWALDNAKLVGTTIPTGAQLVLPTATGGTILTCPGSDNTLTVLTDNTVGIVTYSWSPTTNMTPSSGDVSNPVINPTVGTTYTVTITDADGCTATASQIVSIPTGTAGVWTGADNDDWFQCRNWGNGVVPNSATNVTIPNPVTNLAIIDPLSTFAIPFSGIAYANNITIDNGASLSVLNNSDLRVAGNWLNNGTYADTSGTVTFEGATTPVSIGGSSAQDFYNLTVNKGSSVSSIVNINANTTVANTLTPTNGLIKTGSGNLTLSTPTTIASTAGIDVAVGNLVAGTIAFSNNGLFKSSGGNADIGSLNNTSGSTFTITGGVNTVGGSVSNTGATVSASGGSLTLGVSTTGNWTNSSSTGVTFNGSTISIPGDFSSTASTINSNSATVSIGGNVTNSSSSTFGVGNAIVTVGGSLVSTSSTVNQTSGSLAFNTLGGSYNSNAVFDIDGASNMAISGGTQVFAQANGGSAGDVKIIGGAGTKTITGGTFQFGNSLTNPNQVFKIDNSVLDFNNFTISATNTPTARILTNVATRSAGVLNVNGVLDLNHKIFTVKNSATTGIIASGYVLSESTDALSKLTWNIGNNTGSYTFPFGNTSGDIIPFIFNITTAGSQSATGNISVATYPTAADNTPWVTGVDAMNFESMTNLNQNTGVQGTADRWWVIDANNYTTKPVSSMTFTYANADIVNNTAITQSNLKAQRYNATGGNGNTGGWDPPVYSSGHPSLQVGSTNTVNTANKQVTITKVFNYSPWVLHDGSSPGNEPLPIELVNFKAACNSDVVTINWTTATEVNNDYFTVQRSTDLTHYDNVAIVAGAGNSNTYRNYSAKDQYPVSVTAYYRLMQTDFNGQFEVFDPIAVVCVANGSDVISIFPNPTTDKLNVTMTLNAADRGRIMIFNPYGQLVTSQFVEPAAGFNTYSFDLGNLAQGQYMVSFMMEGKVLPTQKVIISR
jgi:hypothetical protein